MAPDVDQVRLHYVKLLAEAITLLTSAEAPIVLMRRKTENSDAPSPLTAEVAPGNPNLGVMLPYTPLHHLLLASWAFPSSPPAAT